jgi:hypothetical protein
MSKRRLHEPKRGRARLEQVDRPFIDFDTANFELHEEILGAKKE